MNLNIIEIANKIKECGGKLYLVGGAVRDELLRKEAQDKDYCVVGLNSEQFKQLFPQANIRGKAFEVFDLEGSEFAMARTETKIGKGHTEFKIETNPQITIEQDLARRDITINSIAQEVLTGKIIDPFNGINDIKNKIIITKNVLNFILEVVLTTFISSNLFFVFFFFIKSPFFCFYSIL